MGTRTRTCLSNSTFRLHLPAGPDNKQNIVPAQAGTGQGRPEEEDKEAEGGFGYAHLFSCHLGNFLALRLCVVVFLRLCSHFESDASKREEREERFACHSYMCIPCKGGSESSRVYGKLSQLAGYLTSRGNSVTLSL